MNLNQLQQGDVLLQKVNKLPIDAKVVRRGNNDIVLAYGEVTGHAHRISDIDAMFYEADGKFYLKTDKKIKIKHEEHHECEVEPGIWEVGQVQEKDWVSGMVRKVID